MKMRNILLGGVILIYTHGLFAAPGENNPSRPNVLFIAIDDLTATAVGCYGNPLAKTPHLDALAKRGVQFNWAYSQYPWCNPSRASVLTGLRPDQTRIYDEATEFRTTIPDVVTLPQSFRNAGYRVGRAGKIYHQSVPRGIGTSVHDDPLSWERAENPAGRDVDLESKLVNYTPGRSLGSSLAYYIDETGADEDYTDGKVASAVIGMLEQYREQPFFIAAGFYRPHCPYIAPKRYFDLHPLVDIPAPTDPTESLKDVPAAALWTNPPFWGLNTTQQREIIRAYYASVSFVDAQVGRVLAALDRLNLSRNTIVVLWSDHGYHLGEHGQWMKRSLFENVARTPLIVAVPGMRGGKTDRIVELLDLYPTITDLAGISAPESLAGHSLKTLLGNPSSDWPFPAFSQVNRGSSIRTERWRYSEWGTSAAAGTELYDHHADPEELHNLASRPEWTEVVADLRTQLREKVRSQFIPLSAEGRQQLPKENK